MRDEIRALHRIERWKNVVILLFIAFWVGGAVVVVAVPGWRVRAAGGLLIGASLNALGILMHEAIHASLFRHRWLDRIVGFLLGVPVLVSCHAYRVVHLLHHRHNRTELDPDEFRSRFVFYLWLGFGGLLYLFHLPVAALRHGTLRDRVAIVVEYALMGTAYAAAFRFLPADVLLWGWLAPLVVVIAFTNVRGWAEHALTERGDPMTETRTVTSNRVVSFFMCNLNYHLEHHLYPGVPWYNLRRLHDLLQGEQRVVYRSYVRLLWEMVRSRVDAEGLHLVRARRRRAVREGPA